MVKTAAALVLLLPSLLLAAVPPRIDRPVTDTLGLLSPEQTETVASALVRLHQDTGAQMAVLIVGTTEGDPIEDYAMRAAEAWRGGQRGENNGLLYVLALEDRRMRLDVGYGLEEHLPDDAVRRLLDAQGPLVRAGDYATALEHIIQGVRERLPQGEGGRPLPASAVSQDAQDSQDSEESYITQEQAFARVTLTALLFSMLICLVLRPGLRERLGNPLVPILCGVLLAVSLLILHSMTNSDDLDQGTLWRAFFLCGAMMLGSGYLLRNDHELWGTAAMVGTIGGHVFALTQGSSTGGALFFGTLIVCAAATLVVAGVLAMGIRPGIIKLIVFLFGGERASSAWNAGGHSTYGSDSSSSDSSSSDSSSSWSSSSSTWDSSSSSSSSSLWDSSSSSSSSSSWDSSSSSSSSNSSDWSGGGGDFGGGGASSSW